MATDGQQGTLGGYVLEEEIGSGASSVVYRARHERLGRQAAVKVLAMPPSGAWRERFLRESQLAASIDHPNVLRCYAFGDYKGMQYFAMEYIDGGSLEDWMKKVGPLSVGDAVHISISFEGTKK